MNKSVYELRTCFTIPKKYVVVLTGRTSSLLFTREDIVNTILSYDTSNKHVATHKLNSSRPYVMSKTSIRASFK